MPPLPPVPNVVKINVGWLCGGNSKAESILHFQYTGAHPTTSDCTAIAGATNANAVSAFRSLQQVNYGVGVCTVLDLNSTSGAQGAAGTPTSGTRAGTPLSANTCVVIQHLIARRYRGGKPRTYAPFLSESDIATVGTWNPVHVTEVQTAWNSFITSMLTVSSGTTSLSAYVNVSYYSGKALRPSPVIDPITSSLVKGRMGTQRRRMKTA